MYRKRVHLLSFTGLLNLVLIVNQFSLPNSAFAQTVERFSQSATAIVTIGSPATDCPSGWPIELVSGAYVSSGHDSPGGFGHARLHPEEAVDIAVVIGTPVISTFDGVVALADSEGATGYGVQVRVTGVCEGHVFTAVYAHLQAIAGSISVGHRVRRGDSIGRSGNTSGTGALTGPHLHYSFITSDQSLAPEPPLFPKLIEPTCSNDVYPGCGTIP